MATVTISERVRQSGKSYIVQYTDPETAKKKHHKTFRKKADAVAEVNKLRTLLDTGEWGQNPLKKNTAMTFAEACKLCKDEWLKKLEKERIRPSTYQGYLDQLKSSEKAWANKVLASFSREELELWHVKTTKSISPATANRRLFVVKQVFALAHKLKHIYEDPARGISMSNESKHERKRFMKPQEVERLIDGASKHQCKSYLELAVVLAVEHGASKQEILDLKWSDIDFNDGETGSIRFFRQKNQFERVQDIMPRTRQALLARREYLLATRKRKKIKHTGELVLCHLDGRRMLEIKHAWNSLCKSLGLLDFHFHDNRHTYCTNVLHAGGTLKDAKELIGHKTLRMTDRYCEHDREREREVQKRLASRYAQNTTTPAS